MSLVFFKYASRRDCEQHGAKDSYILLNLGSRISISAAYPMPAVCRFYAYIRAKEASTLNATKLALCHYRCRRDSYTHYNAEKCPPRSVVVLYPSPQLIRNRTCKIFKFFLGCSFVYKRSKKLNYTCSRKLIKIEHKQRQKILGFLQKLWQKFKIIQRTFL